MSRAIAKMVVIAVFAVDGVTIAHAQDGQLGRIVLPIPEPDVPHSTVLDARDATSPPRFEV